ncbi:MAG: 50S ribosomal protein L30e [Candidatus Lokiarchaeota archaeon]|nr:50S ribosomal protein L30e [Candidatus Lokiarchaeota archaeon]
MAKMKKSKAVAEKVDLTRKKVKEFDIDTNIKVAYKTGKIVFGRNQVLRSMRQNRYKMIIIANNCPMDLVKQLNHYISLGKDKIFIYKYKGSSWDLGLACAKPYMISIMGIYDYGNSNLQSLISKRI